ncbi:McrC family protein [Streptomyces sp. HPF1205]|uniref:McrC family protein n=1 Tax=Streptomyces sp. HPF1205 TaxID=2873262 RepID=UPI001CED9051|nr:McrC family protein [Streptomyces sp. HPF1205]
MREGNEVRLAEYGSTLLAADQLTHRDLDRMRALQARRCLTLDQVANGWRLKADATVGVLALDRIRLVIEPKFAIPGEQLMTWLAYALGAPPPLPATARRWTTGPEGYADLVAAALLEQCEQLAREGLRRDYVRRQSLEPVLRGRLDITAQVSRRYGQLDQLHVRTFDRAADIWDNRVLGTALRMAHALTDHADLAHDLRTVADSFPQAPTPKAALHALDRTRYTRLNARYGPAHTWARLLLRGGGVADLLTDQGYTANGLLLAMPALWEAVVRRLATDATAPHGRHIVSSSGATGITVRGDLGNPSTFRPDVLLSIPGPEPSVRTHLPLDAKYKRYDHHGVSAADIHQLLTYSAGYAPGTRPQAVIIHPAPGGHSHRTLQVNAPQGTLGSIHVLGIDTHALPQMAAQWIRSTLPWPR